MLFVKLTGNINVFVLPTEVPLTFNQSRKKSNTYKLTKLVKLSDIL